MSEWRKSPRGKWWIKCYNAAWRANRIARELGVEGILTREDVEAVLQDANCFYCGMEQPSPQIGQGPKWDCFGIDHQVSMTAGGLNIKENLVACCHTCNVTKGEFGFHPDRWAQQYDHCIICLTTDRPHEARGMCTTCYSREYDRAHPKRHDNYQTQGKRVHIG